MRRGMQGTYHVVWLLFGCWSEHENRTISASEQSVRHHIVTSLVWGLERYRGRVRCPCRLDRGSNAVAYLHFGGGCGIRTHGTSLPTGFQDQVHRPLGQPSRSCESTQPRAATPRAHTFRSSPPRPFAPKVRARPERVRSSPHSGGSPRRAASREHRAARRDTVGVHRPVGDLSPRPVTIRR